MIASPDGAPETGPVPKAVVVGLAGARLRDDEARWLADARPLGVILFRRNVEDRAQLRALCRDVREALGASDAPMLVDQEGGRVARLGPPTWSAWPAARRLGERAETDLAAGVVAARALARRIAFDLDEVGIDWVCAPVLDLYLDETHAAIGDRAFAADPALVTTLGKAAIQGFLEGGVIPIAKHAPGHGRATVDPHLELPAVDAAAATLEANDFAPFRALRDAPAVMAAHVVYRALDAAHPASCSPRVLDLVRRELGMGGLLFSDDVDMGALEGDVGTRVQRVLRAGCDVALQCNGVETDLRAALAAAPPLSEAARRRFAAARARRRTPAPISVTSLDLALSQALA